MDLYQLIEELYAEKKRIDALVAALEKRIHHEKQPPKRRGRKSMGEGERQIVSDRMKRYWASRRKEPDHNGS